MQILKTTASDFKPKVNMLVYGQGGIGKTTFAATSPKPVVADCEGGTKYFGRRGIEVDVALIETWKDIEDFYVAVKSSQYETIVVDPINELMEKLIAETRINPTFGTKVGLNMAGWGHVKEKMRAFLKALRDMDKHVLIIAHVEEKQDEQNALYKRPMLTTKLKEEIINIMDIVAYMEIIKGADGETKRILRTQTDSDAFLAKDRSSTLGPIVEPDFSKIVEAVVGNKQFTWTKQLDKKREDLDAKFNKDLEAATEANADPDEDLPDQYGREKLESVNMEITDEDIAEVDAVAIGVAEEIGGRVVEEEQEDSGFESSAARAMREGMKKVRTT